MNDVEKSELAWKYFKYILEEYKIRDDNNKLYDEYNNYICAYDSVEDGDSGEVEETLMTIFQYLKLKKHI